MLRYSSNITVQQNTLTIIYAEWKRNKQVLAIENETGLCASSVCPSQHQYTRHFKDYAERKYLRSVHHFKLRYIISQTHIMLGK